MMYQLRSALRDVWRLGFKALLIAVQVAVVGFALGASSGSVNSISRALAVTGEARERNAVYFTSFSTGPVLSRSGLPPQLAERLEHYLRPGSGAHSMLANETTSSGVPAVVGFGDFARNNGLPTAEGPLAYAGSNAPVEVGQHVRVGGISAVVAGRLPLGAGFLDPLMNYLFLDRGVVVIAPYERGFPDVWHEEIASRLVLPDPSPDEVAAYVRAVSLTKDYGVVPQRLNERADGIYEEMLGVGRLMLALFCALTAAAVASTGFMLAGLVRSRLRDYAIERAYGAPLWLLRVRLQVMLTPLFFVPALGVLAFLSSVLPTVTPIFWYLVAGAVTLQLVASAYADRVLRSTPLVELLRTETP